MRPKFLRFPWIGPSVLVAFGALELAGCARVSSLGGGGSGGPSDAEVALIRAKVDAAIKEGLYADAWNLESAVGRDRVRLESIAIAALVADEGPYPRMIEELTGAFGGLSPEGRARVGAESKRAEAEGSWRRAVGIELAAADDAPTYRAAFEVYSRAPASEALRLLRTIERARAPRVVPVSPGQR